MKTAPFEYHRPTSVAQALSLLAEHGDEAKVIAGGQSLLPVMALRLAQPTHLVDIGAIEEINTVSAEDDMIIIGAGVRQSTAERHEVVRDRLGVMTDSLGLIGHPAIRNRGTVGGSIAHADPAAELPAVAVALNAQMVVANLEGRRVIPAEEFFVTHLTTAIQPEEMLTEIRFESLGAEATWKVAEISRRHGDFALGGLVAVSDPQAGIRLAYFGMGATPVRARAAEAVLADEYDDGAIARAIELLTTDLYPDDDIHATAAYRRHIAGVLLRRGLNQLIVADYRRKR